MSANRFLWHWNARMLRREWRVQALILAVVAVAIAVSVGGLLTAYNLTPPPERDYGNGRLSVAIVGDAAGVRAALEEQAHPFSEIEIATVAAPGSAQSVEVRAQQPGDPVGAPLIELVRGRFAAAPDEIAGTDAAMRMLDADLGSTVSVGGREVTLVGLVENPTDLDDEFLHAESLAPFGIDPQRVSTVFLVDANPEEVVFPPGTGSIPAVQERSQADLRAEAALAVSAVATVAILEVALLAGAGFAIVSRRRIRQYGLLGAIGAPGRYVRRVAVMNGFAIGATATIAGVVLGVVSAAAALPTMESLIGHRIQFEVPWWAMLPIAAIAMTATAVAAWWPSRALSRQTIVATIDSQQPRIRSVTRASAIGVAATLAGAAAMIVGFIRVAFPLALGGIVIALVGLLMLAPAVVKLIGRTAGRLPLPARLAARTIARQQGRSAAVVGALVIALGVPAGVAVASASVDDRERRAEDNLPAEMAVLWMAGVADPIPEIPADLDPDVAVRSLDQAREAVPDARFVPIEVAVDPDADAAPAKFDRLGLRPAVVPNLALRSVTEPCNCDVAAYGDRAENGDELLFTTDDAWIATPELVRALGIEVSETNRVGLGVSRWDEAVLHSHRQSAGPDERLDTNSTIPAYRSLASALIWPEAVEAHGWEPVTIGWLVAAGGPFSAAEREDLTAAAGSELLVEVATEPEPRTDLRLFGLLIGGAVGLGILASVVSLHIAESARDLRLLLSIGASPRTGRRIVASTAAILAAGAAAIAVPAGYLPLVAMTADRELDFRFVVPWASLFAIVVLFPLLAGALGWAGGGRSSTKGGGVRSTTKGRPAS